MTPHPAALEAYNRATHSDALPEMQIVPAVDPRQPLKGVSVHWSLYAMAAALCFILTVIGVNA